VSKLHFYVSVGGKIPSGDVPRKNRIFPLSALSASLLQLVQLWRRCDLQVVFEGEKSDFPYVINEVLADQLKRLFLSPID